MTSDLTPRPNIIVTGTPGTGKTTFCQMLTEILPPGFKHVNIGDVVKKEGAHTGYDEEWDTYDIDEDKLLDALDPMFPAYEDEEDSEAYLSKGGIILDHHTCDMFPERWADLVLVLRCDNKILWERLESRGYSLMKIQENNEAEIMQTVLDEAREAYPAEIIVELPSNEQADMERGLDRVKEWVELWTKQRLESLEN
ncbi:Predicted nucleotide kinase/nuclear protein involved oxidative stress response [Phaffia rhodozyma]|uniref:Adenylate kinase isoenzyme 6 homolog n=1 Tax=Phaffia rhodozyma TaxID=264483 RepID=A0A0F7SVG9_PHARH|nr:Predicted nucleotide kinase/nuclear protein involved oxidative stress response [Phaffia rhodozyma]